ncbi:hypothetical protein B0T10DRAFT_17583 [Thelonectria olida]|uniref:Secreted protein n=1 Tax=Thelonectria olida TaxID=1576542 RepID=A0A9P8WIL3_9HYPO|nr:hypothetical protein B0T10DRAFT_17583 [Thelonectria olida]
MTFPIFLLFLLFQPPPPPPRCGCGCAGTGTGLSGLAYLSPVHSMAMKERDENDMSTETPPNERPQRTARNGPGMEKMGGEKKQYYSSQPPARYAWLGRCEPRHRRLQRTRPRCFIPSPICLHD